MTQNADNVSEAFPRILLVTPCTFNHLTGTGVTFTNLFHGWPKDRLAVATSDVLPLNQDVCDQRYSLSAPEFPLVNPFQWLRSLSRTPTPSNASVQYDDRDLTAGVPEYRAAAGRLLQNIIGEAGIPDRGVLTLPLAAWIKQFAPDLLFTICGSIGYLDLVDQIQKQFDLPLVMHLMDDGVTSPDKKGLYARYYRKTYTQKFESLIPRTTARFGICPAMAKAYEERYQTNFDHFQNTINVNGEVIPSRKNLALAVPPRVVYIGSIYEYAQAQSLTEIAHTIASLNDSGYDIRLDIYASLDLFGQFRRQLEISPAISFNDAETNREKFFEIITSADLLCLPVNFDKRSIQFIRLSMPTKVPEYLVSKTPILVYGPTEVAQVAYAQEHQWGHVVSQHNSTLLRKAIIRVLEDMPLRRSLSENAYRVACQFHDEVVVRNRFQQALITAAGKKHGYKPAVSILQRTRERVQLT